MAKMMGNLEFRIEQALNPSSLASLVKEVTVVVKADTMLIADVIISTFCNYCRTCSVL